MKASKYKVPYRERRTIKKFLIPRSAQLRRKKIKEKIIIFLFVAGFVMAGYAMTNSGSSPKYDDNSRKSEIRIYQTKKEKNDELLKSPFLVYAEEKGNLKKFAICAYDKRSNSLAVITFDGHLYIPLFSVGIIETKTISTKFLSEFVGSLRNIFEFELNGPFKVKINSLDVYLLRQSPNNLINDIYQLNSINPEKRLVVKSVEIVPAPTRLSKIGKKTVVILDTSRLNEAASIMFSDNFKKKKVKGSVVILNGSGMPAYGVKAAVLLVNAGYHINAIRNAEKFDYLVTEIRSSREKQASDIQKIIKCGEVKILKATEEIADAVIIVGRDFQGGK